MRKRERCEKTGMTLSDWYKDVNTPDANCTSAGLVWRRDGNAKAKGVVCAWESDVEYEK